MIERAHFTLTLFSALGSGLMAGLFFAFSAFVMTALGRVAPPAGIAVMQSINIAILNPWFAVVFFGTSATSLILAAAALFGTWASGTAYLLAGSLLYLAGSPAVTLAFNVPLNNALAAVDPGSAEGAALWTRYLSTWTAWNHVRTVACLAATASFIVALRTG